MSDLNETSVGETLSTARKKKRLRYKKLSSELNIDESYLVALEENKFEEFLDSFYDMRSLKKPKL